MLVTIGITTYRRLTYLQEAVDSALAQSFDDYEILISQNPHPDSEVRERVQEWCLDQVDRNPKIRYQLNEENLGVSGNMNAIADAARGEFLIFIGDDDRLLPDGLAHLAANVSDDVDIVFANHKVIDDSGSEDVQLTTDMEARFGRANLTPGPLSSEQAEHAVWCASVAIAASLTRADVFRRYRLRTHLTKGDTELYIRMASDDIRFLFCKEQVSEIRYHDDRATTSMVGFGDLVLSLLDIRYRPNVETRRRAALSEMTRQGVTDLLLHGRVAESRQLMSTGYFRRSGIKNILQVFCFQLLPPPTSVTLFRWVYRAYKGVDLTELSRLGHETLSDPVHQQAG